MRLNDHALLDACVARSLGHQSGPSLAPLKRVVDKLAQGPTGIAMSPELRREWEKHASRFMKRWLGSMAARGRIRWCKDRRVNDFRSAALERAESQAELDAIEKDAHITEVAILASLGVISLDDRQRILLRRVAEVYELVGRVQWFNPSQESELCVAWLDATLEDRKTNTIG